MIEHNRPTLGLREKDAVSRVIGSGYVAQGSEVESFENEFCDFLGLTEGHAVALSSGTAALFMALWALNAQGKTVALPVYVCSALRNAVSMVGAKGIFLDVETGGPNVCMQKAKDAQSDILIVPHMFGIPASITEKSQSALIIEDCAQSLGSLTNNIPTGLVGDVGIFSFYATKLITSGGQGGMFVSRNKNLVDEVRDYRNFDCKRDSKARFNFQMTDLQASIGREQLSQLPSFIERRREIFEMYSGLGLNLLTGKSGDSVHYRAILKTSDPRLVMKELLSVGIKTIIPIEDWELLDSSEKYKNAYNLTQSTLSLPIYPSLKDKDVEYIVKHLLRVLK